MTNLERVFMEAYLDNLIPFQMVIEASKVVSSNYPKELLNFMRSNIKYKSTGRFLSPEEVESNKYGDCHDQSNYIHKKLTENKISNGRLFIIEYNTLNAPGGKTHTAVWYKLGNKYYWIETAWSSEAGIHGPFNSVAEIKKEIAKLWDWGNFENLYIGSLCTSKLKYGMSLNDYVVAALPEDETTIKPFATKE